MMNTTTFSSREFNQHISDAKRASMSGPVIITDRGKPAHVLLSIEDYRQITDRKQSIVDILAMPEVGDIEFEPEKLDGSLFKPVEF